MRRMVGVIALAATVIGMIVANWAPVTTANAAVGTESGPVATIAALQTQVASQKREISALQTRVAELQGGSGPLGATQPTPTPASGGTVLSQSGSGTSTTRTFTVSGNWDLQWSYDCSSFFGGTGNFQVFIYNAGGSLSLDNMLINQLGSRDSGVEHYHHGGTLYLVVNSVCSWDIAVTD